MNEAYDPALARACADVLMAAHFRPPVYDEGLRVARSGFLVEPSTYRGAVWVSQWMAFHERPSYAAAEINGRLAAYTATLEEAGWGVKPAVNPGGYPYLLVHRPSREQERP